MSRRAENALVRETRRLGKKSRPSKKKAAVNDAQKDEFYARFLNGDPDRKLSYSEILEILEHSLAKLEASMQKKASMQKVVFR